MNLKCRRPGLWLVAVWASLAVFFPAELKSQKASVPVPAGHGTDACEYGVCISRGDRVYGVNADKSFAMHSVMKFPQALYVADWLDRHAVSLQDSVLVVKDSLQQDTWSPMLGMFAGRAYFSYADLLGLSLEQSDNNACDLLFGHCGSPQEVEAYIRELGFPDIHVRHTEREMAADKALASRNSCTPSAMVRLLGWFLKHRGDNEYLAFVWETMGNCATGQERLPAAFTEGVKVVHKTGTGFAAADKTQDRNDAGIVIMPDGTYAVVSVFVPHARKERDVARAVRKSRNRILQ